MFNGILKNECISHENLLSVTIGDISDGGSVSSATQFVSALIPNPPSSSATASSTTEYFGTVRVYVNGNYTLANPFYDTGLESWVIMDHPISLNAGSNEIFISIRRTDGTEFSRSDSWIVNGDFGQAPWRVELTWDTDLNDLDLHVVRNSGTTVNHASGWDTTDHVYWWLDSQSWGELDYDETDGFGPENITINSSAPAGVYRIYVKYYDPWGVSGNVVATVRIYKDGNLNETKTHTFTAADENYETNSYDSGRDWFVGTITIN